MDELYQAIEEIISWLTKSRVPRAHHTCETINKSTKATPYNEDCGALRHKI